MDNVTHTLFALTLGRTGLGRGGRGAITALVLASNAPDLDIVATFGGSVSYLAWHRGPTHGPLGIVGLGLMTAVLVWGGGRLARQRGEGGGERVASFTTLLMVSLVGVLFHILMDLPTSYGTRLLSPFSWRWYAIDLLPIIDVYLLAALVTGLLRGRRSAEAGRRCATIVFVLMAANYGGRAIAHHEALNLTARMFGATPPACDPQAPESLVQSWPRADPSPGAAELCTVDTAALPTFLSPFQWRVVRRLPGAYWVDDVDILDRGARSPERSGDRRVVVTNQSRAVFEAAKTPTGQVLLGFSRFPHAAVSVDPARITTVRITDMRFAVIDPDRDVRRPAPFTLTVTIGPEHEILQERLGQ